MADRRQGLVQSQHCKQKPRHWRRRRHILHAAVAADDVDSIIGCNVILGEPCDILRSAQALCILDHPLVACRRRSVVSCVKEGRTPFMKSGSILDLSTVGAMPPSVARSTAYPALMNIS